MRQIIIWRFSYASAPYVSQPEGGDTALDLFAGDSVMVAIQL